MFLVTKFSDWKYKLLYAKVFPQEDSPFVFGRILVFCDLKLSPSFSEDTFKGLPYFLSFLSSLQVGIFS